MVTGPDSVLEDRKATVQRGSITNRRSQGSDFLVGKFPQRVESLLLVREVESASSCLYTVILVLKLFSDSKPQGSAQEPFCILLKMKVSISVFSVVFL